MSDSRRGDPAWSPADSADLPDRKVIRLPHYDYSKPGQYFLTICVQNHECKLGHIVDQAHMPSPAGGMIDKWWKKIPEKFPMCSLDAHVIMPNHVHGIIYIHDRVVGATPCGRPSSNAPNPAVGATPRGRPPEPGGRPPSNTPETAVGATPRGRPFESGGRPPGPSGETLFQIVSWFKTMTTNEYIRGVKSDLWPRFDGTFWQRGYYEHVIESDEELNSIRDYISRNPRTWAEDAENPDNQSGRPRGTAPTRVSR